MSATWRAMGSFQVPTTHEQYVIVGTLPISSYEIRFLCVVFCTHETQSEAIVNKTKYRYRCRSLSTQKHLYCQQVQTPTTRPPLRRPCTVSRRRRPISRTPKVRGQCRGEGSRHRCLRDQKMHQSCRFSMSQRRVSSNVGEGSIATPRDASTGPRGVVGPLP